tara:strand:+ start:17 stop:259 length:243 start_codon:yes stop_codon:yes gene_type:complete
VGQYGRRRMSKKMQYRFVEFSFSIPSKGLNEQELKEFAIEELFNDHYDIIKDILRTGGEHATMGEVIDEAEVQDYFWEEE